MTEEHTPQEEVVAQAPEIEMTEEIQHKNTFINDYKTRLLDMTKKYRLRQMAEIEAGAPTLAEYQYLNCLTLGPYQTFGNPPYRPSKIVAGGETCTMYGVIWINPASGPGGSLPGTIVLGDRDYRARFESINLSNVTNGPEQTFTGTFASPAPEVTVLEWEFEAPDPNINPDLIEVNFTFDVTVGGQPFAAFSTWHFDPDREPEFLGLPGAGPHLQFERPARFLIYRLTNP